MAFTDRSPIVLQGKVFIQERTYNGAVLGPLKWVGNAENCILSVKQKEEDIKDNFTGKGLTIAKPVVETDAELKIQVLDMSMQNWADATWGSWGGALEADSVAGESVILEAGCYVQLAHPGVSNVVIAGAVEDTDYSIESAASGLIRVLDDSPAAPAGTPLTTTVAYDYAAYNGRVDSFVLGQKFYKVVINGKNLAQGNQPCILTINQVQLGMSSKFDFISKKKMEFELMGSVLYDGYLPDAQEAGDLSNLFSIVKG
jgi:hypothetical protein